MYMPYPTILMEIAYISCRIRRTIGLQVQGMADLGKNHIKHKRTSEGLQEKSKVQRKLRMQLE